MPGKNGSRKTRRRKPEVFLPARQNAMELRIAWQQRQLKSRKLPAMDRDRYTLGWLSVPNKPGTSTSQGHVRPELLDPPRQR